MRHQPGVGTNVAARTGTFSPILLQPTDDADSWHKQVVLAPAEQTPDRPCVQVSGATAASGSDSRGPVYQRRLPATATAASSWCERWLKTKSGWWSTLRPEIRA